MTARRTRPTFETPLLSVEICAGAGGQASGLHEAGFDHRALVEWDSHAVETLKLNIGSWAGWNEDKIGSLASADVRDFLSSPEFKAIKDSGDTIDLLAGGVPCPPFSLAGNQLGPNDERDLFPAMLEIVASLRPRAIMIENVRGILEPPEVFIEYRREILEKLREYGYVIPEIRKTDSPQQQDLAMRRVWRRLDAPEFGVPQLRPRAILVVIHKDVPGAESFAWPVRDAQPGKDLFETLKESMLTRCKEYWKKNKYGMPAEAGDPTGEDVYNKWLTESQKAAKRGITVAPTLVGGSRKHGGADLGPTRAKRAWEALGIDANGVANDPKDCVPERDLFRPAGPMLTVQQAASVQGFRDWKFSGGKTAQYRQVGNAFPPPVAEAVGRAIAAVLRPAQRDELLAGYEIEGGRQVQGSSSDAFLFAEDILVGSPTEPVAAAPALAEVH
ncbi:DNA cytosine methyltransferase [Streptomyces sp. NPDC101132]|uniref:DNA cytosine methyltransferase n=1 Tax=Streptomyces sp. NPDC101132 TaxID=3366110 RepID=UPI00382F3D2A